LSYIGKLRHYKTLLIVLRRRDLADPARDRSANGCRRTAHELKSRADD